MNDFDEYNDYLKAQVAWFLLHIMSSESQTLSSLSFDKGSWTWAGIGWNDVDKCAMCWL
jgi:hypothetical protein